MRITVEVELDVNESVSDKQVNEWLYYKMGYSGCCALDNPLVDKDLEAKRVTWSAA